MGKIKDTMCDGDDDKLVRQKRSRTISTTAAEMREVNYRFIGQENINAVLTSVVILAYPMDQPLYLAR